MVVVSAYGISEIMKFDIVSTTITVMRHRLTYVGSAIVPTLRRPSACQDQLQSPCVVAGNVADVGVACPIVIVAIIVVVPIFVRKLLVLGSLRKSHDWDCVISLDMCIATAVAIVIVMHHLNVSVVI